VDSAVCALAREYAVVKLTSSPMQNLHRGERAIILTFLMVVMMRGLNFHREQPNHQHSEDGILRERLMTVAGELNTGFAGLAE
jgi:hypothetical protein